MLGGSRPDLGRASGLQQTQTECHAQGMPRLLSCVHTPVCVHVCKCVWLCVHRTVMGVFGSAHMCGVCAHVCV